MPSPVRSKLFAEKVAPDGLAFRAHIRLSCPEEYRRIQGRTTPGSPRARFARVYMRTVLRLVFQVIQLHRIFAQNHARDFVRAADGDLSIQEHAGQSNSQRLPPGFRSLPANLLPIVSAAPRI